MKKKSPATNTVDGSEKTVDDALFLYEDDKLVPFSPNDYARSIVYQTVETFMVERRFVKPEEKQDILYEGRKPSKKTIPILILKDDEQTLLSSWEELEANPEKLASVEKVIAAKPVKQVFVLKRK